MITFLVPGDQDWTVRDYREIYAPAMAGRIAVAIGLSEARQKGAKVPRRTSTSGRSRSRRSSR